MSAVVFAQWIISVFVLTLWICTNLIRCLSFIQSSCTLICVYHSSFATSWSWPCYLVNWVQLASQNHCYRPDCQELWFVYRMAPEYDSWWFWWLFDIKFRANIMSKLRLGHIWFPNLRVEVKTCFLTCYSSSGLSLQRCFFLVYSALI